MTLPSLFFQKGPEEIRAARCREWGTWMVHELIWWLLRAGWLFPAPAESCCHCPLPLAWAHHPAQCLHEAALGNTDLSFGNRHGQRSLCQWDSSCLDLFFFLCFSHCDLHCSSLMAVSFCSQNYVAVYFPICYTLGAFSGMPPELPTLAPAPHPSFVPLAPSHSPLAALLLGPAGIPRYRGKIYSKGKSRSSSWIELHPLQSDSHATAVPGSWPSSKLFLPVYPWSKAAQGVSEGTLSTGTNSSCQIRSVTQ